MTVHHFYETILRMYLTLTGLRVSGPGTVERLSNDDGDDNDNATKR